MNRRMERSVVVFGIVVAMLSSAVATVGAVPVSDIDNAAAAARQADTDPIVLVDSYRDAPNLASLVEAGDYSNLKDAPVLRLYQAFFNRPPDLKGSKYWLNIRRDGYTASDIAGFMGGSTEFRNEYLGTSNAEYVAKVYTNVLGRGYDQRGYNYWLGLLDSGQLSRTGTVFYITANAEFIRNYGFTNDRLEPASLELVSCNARTEELVIRNTGGSSGELVGWMVHDRGPQFTIEDLGAFQQSIAAGATLTLVSGPSPIGGSGRVVIYDRNIWNNTGDTATLVSPAGVVTSEIECS